MSWTRYNKYGAKKTVVDGITFDSQKEARRYSELKILEKMGEIDNIRRQVKYTLIPRQKDERGKLLERPVEYIADFVYRSNRTGEEIVEDVKGYRPAEYVIKRKLMLEKYGIRIKET